MNDTTTRTFVIMASLLSAAACDDTLEAPDSEAREGINGTACVESPYNCKLRSSGGPRVKKPNGDTEWDLNQGAPILDGNGDLMGVSSLARTKFNWGQRRSFAGELHVFAMSTSNQGAGWMPLESIKERVLFEEDMGSVQAKGAGLAEMGCYQIRNWHDPVLEFKKVVKDSQKTAEEHERAGDYLPIVRANGRRSANLAFNVPGFNIGGVAIDHYPAGTEFRRLKVPTHHEGRASIDVPLWGHEDGHWLKPAGTMTFYYGYIIAKDGTRRNGWMAADALAVCGSDLADPPNGAPGDSSGEDPTGADPTGADPTGADPSGGEPTPSPNQCYVRCCDGSLQGPAATIDPDACYEASHMMCPSHVERVEWNGQEVWERTEKCWAKCANRDAYHEVENVTEDCNAKAKDYCKVGTRGAFQDAIWSRCEPA